MRPGIAIAVVFAVGVLVAAIGLLPSDGGSRGPESDEERMATVYALVYARAVQVGDARIACGVARDEAARALGCGTERPRVRSCGPLNVTGVDVDGTQARVHVGECTLQLVPGGDRWEVAKVLRDERAPPGLR